MRVSPCTLPSQTGVRVAGMRKPDPAIYKLACRRLGVPPSQVVYLDDIGVRTVVRCAVLVHVLRSC